MTKAIALLHNITTQNRVLEGVILTDSIVVLNEILKTTTNSFGKTI